MWHFEAFTVNTLPAAPVFHVITGLDVGGAETMLVALAEAEAAAGAAPVIISLTAGGALVSRLTDVGVPVFELGMKSGRPGLGGVFRLTALIRHYRPSVVMGWMYHANLLSTMALSASGRHRATAHFWGIRCSDMDLSNYGALFRLVVRASARLSWLPEAIIYNSDAGISAHQRLGFLPRRTLLIENGIDTVRFKPDSRARERIRAALGIDAGATVLVVTARVDPMKDYATLLSALEQVPGVTAVIMGEGTGSQLPDTPGVIRLGRRSDVPDILSAADMIVSSSAYGEGFSNAVAEGMACGLPAIATDVGDVRRIIGDTGTVVPPRDPEALAAAIREMGAAENRAERGQAARQRIVENFSLERTVARFRQLYENGLQEETQES
jgi:glycosyltransferase involved in cell wall biosynthesis